MEFDPASHNKNDLSGLNSRMVVYVDPLGGIIHRHTVLIMKASGKKPCITHPGLQRDTILTIKPLYFILNPKP